MLPRRCLFATLVLLATQLVCADDAVLPAAVQRSLDYRQLPADSLSAFVVDVESGEVLLSWNDDVPRNPGSTIKLLTTLVGLDLLGPTYTWKTRIYAVGEVTDGHLHGDLLLKGGGDPFLVTERVWQMLRQLRQLGIRQIDGDLLLDDSYFDVADTDPGAFDRQPLRAYNVVPNALMMNFKVVRYWFEPDHDAGTVRVQLEPPLENVVVDNRLSLVPGACRGYQRGIAIHANEAVDTITLSGRFPAGCSRYAMDRTALSHNAFAYGLFTNLWRESGGSFDGGWKNVKAPADLEPLMEFESMPLADVITRVNKFSNNVMARHMLYTLAAEVLGEPGTEEGGRKVIADWLTDKGLEFSKLALNNGAGLSRDTRMTAHDFGAMLAFAWRQSYMPEYLASMALSGLDGTMRYRFRGGPLIGSAHLKTGSLDHVAAIAGYLQSKSGRRFAVVAMQNATDVHRGTGEEVQEALLRWVYEQ